MILQVMYNVHTLYNLDIIAYFLQRYGRLIKAFISGEIFFKKIHVMSIILLQSIIVLKHDSMYCIYKEQNVNQN